MAQLARCQTGCLAQDSIRDRFRRCNDAASWTASAVSRQIGGWEPNHMRRQALDTGCLPWLDRLALCDAGDGIPRPFTSPLSVAAGVPAGATATAGPARWKAHYEWLRTTPWVRTTQWAGDEQSDAPAQPVCWRGNRRSLPSDGTGVIGPRVLGPGRLPLLTAGGPVHPRLRLPPRRRVGASRASCTEEILYLDPSGTRG